jgi:aerobic carbon-monoxide dehydrogenase medium subunit
MVVFHRRLPKFEYLSPRTLDEALNILSVNKGKAVVLAGGTDLIPKLKTRKIKVPDHIVDLKTIPDLNYIRFDIENGLTLGALATIHAIEKSSLIREKYSLLFEAAESMASVQVRNRGTVAGNICNAIPSADMAPALLCMEANLKLVSRNGERTVEIENFFTGPNQTEVKDDEILTEIRLPTLPSNTRGHYLKLSPRRDMDLAVVGVGVLGIIENNTFQDVRISLGAVAPIPFRAKSAENMLRGQKVSPETLERASEMAGQEARPIDDHRASAEYRRDMVKVLARRALEQICATDPIRRTP